MRWPSSLRSLFRMRPLFWLLLFLPSLRGRSQETVLVPRADGAKTPMRVYSPKVTGCAPVAIISHGAGGSEDGYQYLARGLRDQGWMTIVVGHRESGGNVLRREVLRHGLDGGLTQMVTDPEEYKARFLDIGAALEWATVRCKPPYRALLGHSMGARTVLLEAGAKNKIGLAPPASGLDRFDAYVALSPSGPDAVSPPHAWANIRKPLLILTGTRDQALNGDWRSRTAPYYDLPPGCHWLGVVDGASHLNFAGVGFGASRTASRALPVIYAFLDSARSGNCILPPATPGIIVKAQSLAGPHNAEN